MRKDKIKALFKAKGFYAVLLVCFVAVTLLAGMYSISTNEKDQKNMVDLNEPAQDLAKEEANNELAEIQTESADQSEPVESADNELIISPDKELANNEQIYNRYDEYDEIFLEDAQEGTTEQLQETMGNKVVTTEKTDKDEVKEETKEVISSKVEKNDLNFKESNGIIWPIEGNVILNYNMDGTVYFQTLDQYKCNPAIIISSKVGQKVKAAANGVVEKIETLPETGITLTVSLGNNYKMIYGQLSEVNLKAGDKINEGDIIGKIGTQTVYYELEGPNLYFQITKKEESVNPLSLIRE